MTDPIQDLDDAIERYVEACEANNGHLPSVSQVLHMIADRLENRFPTHDTPRMH